MSAGAPSVRDAADHAATVEIGELYGQHENFYWKVKSYHRLRYVLARVAAMPGVIVFACLYPVIVLAAVLVRVYLRLVTPAGGSSSATGMAALETFQRFLLPYPTAVYSPLAKSLELELFTRYKITGPVLEVGVGDGLFSSLLVQQSGTTLTCGIDLIYETIRSSEKYRAHSRLAVADAEEIPLPTACVSTVVMNNLIHHLPDRRRALAEVGRALAPGGLFLFTDNLAGWSRFTIDYRLLERIGLGRLAERLSRLKLAVFAQRLIASERFWQEPFVTDEWEVIELSPFVSRRGMTISSLFEYLNLKQGQPTHRPLRWLLKLAPLRRLVESQMAAIVRVLIMNDEAWCREGGAAFLFVALRKKGRPVDAPSAELDFCCPRCRVVLDRRERFWCSTCGRTYPVVDGIPVLIAYAESLPHLADQLSFFSRRKAREHVT